MNVTKEKKLMMLLVKFISYLSFSKSIVDMKYRTVR